jgi:hypothetical protein
MAHPSQRPIQKAKERLVKAVAAEPGFVGAGVSVGQGGRPEIVVQIVGTSSPVAAKVPQQWEGFSVRMEIVGNPKKF